MSQTSQTDLAKQARRARLRRLISRRLANLPMDSSPEIGGMAAVRTASFSSENKWRGFTFSTVKTENVRRGVLGWRGELPGGLPTTRTALSGSSGREFRRKNPREPGTMVVELSPRYREVLWSVYYSASPNDSRFTVRISAATGRTVKVEK